MFDRAEFAALVADLRADLPGMRLAAGVSPGLWVEDGLAEPAPRESGRQLKRSQGPLEELVASSDPEDGVGKLLGPDPGLGARTSSPPSRLSVGEPGGPRPTRGPAPPASTRPE